MSFPPCPPVLKAIQHYMKIAAEHEVRDPAVTYWSRLYALNCGLKIDSKSKESLTFLTALMDWLEKQKKALSDNETVTNEVAAQAHFENYALQLFSWADQQDRAGVFNKNVVKSFYTAGILFDVCTVFSNELSEDIEHARKYAKWKAAYIHNCLKNGETPIPGPMKEDGTEMMGPPPQQPRDENTAPPPPQNYPDPSSNLLQPPRLPSPPREMSGSLSNLDFSNGTSKPKIEFEDDLQPSGATLPALSAEDMTKAQKFCKWAASALNYDDVPTAITNLEQALRLLKSGGRS